MTGRCAYLELFVLLVEVDSFLMHEADPVQRKGGCHSPGTGAVVPHVSLALDHTVELTKNELGNEIIIGLAGIS